MHPPMALVATTIETKKTTIRSSHFSNRMLGNVSMIGLTFTMKNN